MNIPSKWYTAVRLSKRTQLKYEVIEVNTSDAGTYSPCMLGMHCVPSHLAKK